MDKKIFRPKARIIKTLGSELIKDSYAAIIELVKNAYDADSKWVNIKLINLNNVNKAQIIIEDSGHGMPSKTVTDIWMIPGTSDKINRKTSPNGRILLGAKGIGRLSAGRLGNFITLVTTDKMGITTSLIIDWSKFDADKFLDEIEFLIESKKTKYNSGTVLTIEDIFNKNIAFTDWSKEDNIIELKKELRKLLSPVSVKKEDFKILLDLKDSGIENLKKYSGIIEPLPVLDYFDYRLWGNVDNEGNVNLNYKNGVDLRIPEEKINFTISINSDKTYNCGQLYMDIRVFDRDPESIEELIRRSNLIDESGNYFGKLETKRLLTDLSGVGIYRENFRIRPYGDSGYDWLELDKERVQNPSLRIGSDQISGYIFVENENNSGLKEKSSRESFFENEPYYTLIEVVHQCLARLEEFRFDFRRKTNRGRQAGNIEDNLSKLFDLSKIENSIEKIVKSDNSKDFNLKEIRTLIKKEKEIKAKEYEKIQETIARYEGQVTLGKIIGVLLHEGRKPLKYIDEQSLRVERWIKMIEEKNIIFKNDLIFTQEEIIERLVGLKNESKLIINLFNKVDPLAVRKRIPTFKNSLNKIIKQIIILFEYELKKENINIFCDNYDMSFKGVNTDIYIVFTNLFDNSIYWLSTNKSNNRYIRIKSYYEKNILVVEFSDNGPGIKDNYIESIFEPGFSTKNRGTGLGLAIVGEALQRNNAKITLIENKKGTIFKIELQKGV
jgi:signal transduction histidine kinase